MKNFLILFGIAFVGLIIFNLNLGKSSSKNHTDSETADNVLDLMVMGKAIKTDPKLFQKLSTPINKFTDVDKVVQSTQSGIMYSIQSIIKQHTDDAHQRRWAEVYLQQLRDTQRAGDCLPEYKTPKELQALLSQSTQQQTQKVLTDILANQSSQAITASSGGLEIWRKIHQQIYKRLGDDMYSDDTDKKCQLKILQLEHMLSLPDNESAIVVRWYLNSEMSYKLASVGVF